MKDKAFGTGCVNVTPFGAKIKEMLNLQRLRELITCYFNINRKGFVAC